MKNLKKVISIVLVISILVIANVVPVSATYIITDAKTKLTDLKTKFSDVKSTTWYYNYVNKLIVLGITTGVGNNMFAPNDSVTKAEFVTFVCKANKLSQEDGYTFNDTKAHWSSKWISAAITANIIDKGTEFSPNKAITRQEAVEMLCRSLGLYEDTTSAAPFTDVKDNKGYSSTAYKEYLMQGSLKDNLRYFYPNSDIKRSEVSAVVVNLVDYKADTAKYKTLKKAELDKQEQANTEAKEEAQRYADWKESVKGIPAALLNNTTGLGGKTVYESNKFVYTEDSYLVNWGAFYKMTADEFANESVRVGTMFANAFLNENYKNTDEFASVIKETYDIGNMDKFLQNKFKYINSNTIVTEGKFITSKSLLVDTSSGLTLRGTARYMYLSPTSSKVLNSEVVSNTGKASQLGVWYEQDFEVTFFSENEGLKCTNFRAISKIRLAE